MNNDKKKKETPRIPRRDRGGLVVAPTPRPIEPDHPGRKIIREVREANEANRLAALPSQNENQTPMPLSVLVADSKYGQEMEGALTAPEEEFLFLKSGQPQEGKVDGHRTEVASMLATNEGAVASMLATNSASGQPQEGKVDGHKRDRHRKGRIKYTGRFEPNIFSKIRHFCVDKKLDLQEFFELAAVHFIEQVAVHQEKEVASMLAHDDILMIWKSTDDIITRYRAMTGNRWKPADDRAAARYNQTDIRLVEIGMLYTALRTKAKKINSFAYFIPEIEEVLAVKLGEETIDALLKHRRAQWEKLKKEREQKQKG